MGPLDMHEPIINIECYYISAYDIMETIKN